LLTARDDAGSQHRRELSAASECVPTSQSGQLKGRSPAKVIRLGHSLCNVGWSVEEAVYAERRRREENIEAKGDVKTVTAV